MTRRPKWIVERADLLPFIGYTLVCIWPGLFFLGHNAAQFYWMGRSAVLVVLALCGLLWALGVCLAVVPSLLVARWPVARAFSVGIVGMFLLFSQVTIRTWLRESLMLDAAVARAVSALIIVGFLAVAWRLSRHEPVRTALTVAAALVALIPVRTLASVAPAMLAVPSETHLQLHTEADVPAQAFSGENVYYVILDGYGGRSSLSKYVGYDIDPFLEGMRDLGYSHIDSARTNYTSTYVSLMAMLEMDYIVSEASPRYTDRLHFFPPALWQGPEPRAVRLVTAAGYDFIHLGNSWARCLPRPQITCLGRRDSYAYISEVAAAFLAPTQIRQALARLWPSRGNNALASLSAGLQDLTKRERPYFLFVHQLSPHDPYRSGDCSQASAERPRSDDGNGRRQQYKSSITCVNEAVLSLARSIQLLDPTAIVVFQSDHGSDFEVDWARPLRKWSDAAIDERSSILNLVHTPEPCRQWLRPTLSQINTMRLVFGCLERRPPDYIEERTYLTTYEPFPDFGLTRDVTARLPERRQSARPTGSRE